MQEIQNVPQNSVSSQEPVFSASSQNPNVVTVSGPPEKPIRKFAFGKIFKIILGLFVVFAIVITVAVFLLPVFKQSLPVGKGAIVYWGLWEDEKAMQEVIVDFKKLNPGVNIEYVKQDTKQYRESLSARIENETGPDIFVFHNTWYPMISSFLSPFPTNVFTKEEFTKTFYPVAQRDLIKNGVIYGIPQNVDTLAMYVNTDLFKSAGISVPKTWNDFIYAARTLTVKDENGKIKTAGAAMGTYDNISHAADIVSLLVLQNGGDLNDINASRERVEGALNFYASFATDADNVWDDTLDPSILAFSKGNLAMYFGYSDDYFSIKQFNSNLSFQIVPVPQLEGQNVNLASYWALGVSSKTEHQKEAFSFVKYLSSRQVQQKLYEGALKEKVSRRPYARVDLAQSLSDNPSIYPFVLQSPTAYSSLFVDGTYDNGLNQQLNTYLGNAIKSTYKNDSSESEFETLSEGITQVLQQYAVK